MEVGSNVGHPCNLQLLDRHLELLHKNIAVMRRQLECEFCEEILRDPYTYVPKGLPACAILIMYPSTGLSTVATHYA